MAGINGKGGSKKFGAPNVGPVSPLSRSTVKPLECKYSDEVLLAHAKRILLDATRAGAAIQTAVTAAKALADLCKHQVGSESNAPRAPRLSAQDIADLEALASPSVSTVNKKTDSNPSN